MADYISILDKAVSALADNNEANRALIYEKARAAIERKLRAMDPTPPEAAILRQLEQLEEAIGTVESSNAPSAAVNETTEAVEALAVPSPSPSPSPAPAPALKVPEGFIDEPILIDGIGEKTAELLANEGVTKISQIAAMDDAQLAKVTQAIGYPGFEVTQEWKQQSIDMLSGELPRGKTNQDRLIKLLEARDSVSTPSGPVDPVVTQAPAENSQASAAVEADPAPAAIESAETPAEGVPSPAPESFETKTEETKQQESNEDYDAFLQAFSNAGATKPAPENTVEQAAKPEPAQVSEPAANNDVASHAYAKPDVPTFVDPGFLGEPHPATSAGQNHAPAFPTPSLDEPVRSSVAASASSTRPSSPAFVSELENDFAPRERSSQRPHPALKQKKSSGGKIVTWSLLILLLGGAAAGAYFYREPIIDLSQQGISAARKLLNVEDVTKEPLASNEAQQSTETNTSTKDDARLGNGDVTPEPAPVAVEPIKPKPEAPETPVRNVDNETATVEVQEETPVETAQAQSETAPAGENSVTDTQETLQQPATAEAAVLGGEKSYLYEEALGNTGASRDEGNIVWRLENEPPEDGAPPEAVIKGVMEVPSRGLTMNLSIKRNVDPALSASHLIEMAFTPTAEFSGGNIDNISRFVMKANEQARGESLVGIPVRIDLGFFWIALNNLDQAQKTNLSLLENGDWVDIPVTYLTGRRALLTFEKGTSGKEVFASAFADWKNR